MPLPYPPFKPCPCGSGRSYAACCQPAHKGQQAAETPEALMRSRYTAFFLQDELYLLRTWHPDHRPAALHLADGTRYLGLTIHRAEGQEVEFTVRFSAPGDPAQRFRERGRFVQLEGAWVYLDGIFLSKDGAAT